MSNENSKGKEEGFEDAREHEADMMEDDTIQAAEDLMEEAEIVLTRNMAAAQKALDDDAKEWFPEDNKDSHIIANPTTFTEHLWNIAGPSYGAMGCYCEVLLDELQYTINS